MTDEELREKIREVIDREVGDRELGLIGEFSSNIQADKKEVPSLVNKITDEIMKLVLTHFSETEIGNQYIEACTERDMYEQENQRLREALEEIASYESHWQVNKETTEECIQRSYRELKEMARKALEGEA